jgi:long-chain fatty acid transport protein
VKKHRFIILLVSLSGIVSSPVFGGGLIQKQNMSADYLRTLNRQAATDYADIAVYNPAGIMEMDIGKYVKFDLQYIDKEYSNKVPGVGELTQDQSSIIPGFFAIHKESKWAGYLAVSLIGGGGKIDYKNGNARSVLSISSIANLPLSDAGSLPQRVEGDSLYYGYNIGGAYSVNDIFSLSAGLRYVTAYKEYTLSVSGGQVYGNMVVETRDEADGWSGVFGANIAPCDRINIGLRFETATKLDFELETRQGATLLAQMGIMDGRKVREDLPGLLGIGVSWVVVDDLKLDVNYIHYLEKAATWDTGLDGAGDSYDLGFSGEYRFNDQWMASGGYVYSDNKLDDAQLLLSPEEPQLDAHTVAIGGVWSPTEAFDITLGIIRVFYTDATDSLGINYDKDVSIVSCGVQYSFR